MWSSIMSGKHLPQKKMNKQRKKCTMSLYYLLYIISIHCSRMKTLNVEESLAKEAFTKECFRDPTVRDRMSMLTRAFGGRKKVN